MKYRFAVYMYKSEDCSWVKSQNAYTSQKRAEKACDDLNTYESEHPVYGKVYYKVVQEA